MTAEQSTYVLSLLTLIIFRP